MSVRCGASRVLAGIALALCPSALALNPALDVSQFAHMAWNSRDGFPKGMLMSMAQTPDGYLWLATELGLERFDGVKSTQWQPPRDQRLPSNNTVGLLAARDGTLWIGTWKGLASWKDGKLKRVPEMDGFLVVALTEDREGTVWAGGLASGATGKLCAIRNGRGQCYGGDGTLGRGIISLHEDRKGNLWAGTMTGLWRWKPGPPQFYPLPGQAYGISAPVDDGDGILLGLNGRVARLAAGKIETAFPLPATARQSQTRLHRDRDGGLWILTDNVGIIHVHHGRTDTFSQTDGLSSNRALGIFEDREGNVWVATGGGLDRFREYAVTTLADGQGLKNVGGQSVVATRDGSIWVGTAEGLMSWRDGTVRRIPGGGPMSNRFLSMFVDRRGRVWATDFGGVGYVENDRLVPVRGVPGGLVYAAAEDREANLWIVSLDRGLVEMRNGRLIQEIPWGKLSEKEHALAIAADPLQGGLWLGFEKGGVAYFRDNQIRAWVSDGLGDGAVYNLGFDRDGALWAATQGGFSLLRNGRWTTLSGKNGLPCDAVHWVLEDDTRSLWMGTTCGLVRIARSEFDAWSSDPGRRIDFALFDNTDGVQSRGDMPPFGPTAAKSPDGRIWFTTWNGLSVLDPRHLPYNKIPPPVHIERITTDDKSYEVRPGLRLPASPRNVWIKYTAVSLAAPEKIHFKYKLEGQDPDWTEAVNDRERQVHYSNLMPRDYRFRVMASNNSGVWNEDGDALEFSIAPAYYQTAWFYASCVAAFLAILWVLYRLRLYQIAREFNAQLDGRVDERLRVARDLHDTLLQSFQAALIQMQAAYNMFSRRPEKGVETLQRAISISTGAIVEGREAIQNMRSSTVLKNDLARALRIAGDQQAALGSAKFEVRVQGTSRDIHPILRDEVYRIAEEAIRNAFQHSGAQAIEAEIVYRDSLRVRIRDDGKGIDAAIMNEGRSGHYGLAGMRERAERIGGTLDVRSGAGAGTEIQLSIPGTIAFGGSGAGWVFSRFRRKDKSEAAAQS